MTRTVRPVSSRSSLATPSSSVSPNSSVPPGIDHSPSNGSLPRLISSARPWSIITPPTPTIGRSGYSREEAIYKYLSVSPACLEPAHRMGLTSCRYIIRSTVVPAGRAALTLDTRTEDGALIRCPECSAEIDVDEDEVEEGEILSCPECESELEVSQIHPVHLNIISEDMDDDEDEEDEEEEIGENGDLPEEEEEDDEEEDEE